MVKLEISNKVLDGVKAKEVFFEELKVEVSKIKENGIQPKFVVLMIGKDERSEVYVKNKIKIAESLGIVAEVLRFEGNEKIENVLVKIEEINLDESIHGMIVQLPLPKSWDKEKIIGAISPKKDLDGLSDVNMGKLAKGKDGLFLPCTAVGVLKLLEVYGIEVEGKVVTVVGQGNLAGRPIGLLFSKMGATVRMVNSKTVDLRGEISDADIVVSAVGRGGLYKCEWFNEKQVLVDVGIRVLGDGKVVGDFEFEKMKEVVRAISPVPGGVGRMTIMGLMIAVVKSASRKI